MSSKTPPLVTVLCVFPLWRTCQKDASQCGRSARLNNLSSYSPGWLINPYIHFHLHLWLRWSRRFIIPLPLRWRRHIHVSTQRKEERPPLQRPACSPFVTSVSKGRVPMPSTDSVEQPIELLTFELQYFENGQTQKVQIRWECILGLSQRCIQQLKTWLECTFTSSRRVARRSFNRAGEPLWDAPIWPGCYTVNFWGEAQKKKSFFHHLLHLDCI